MLEESFAVRHDHDAYVGFVRRSTEMLEQVMRADVENAEANRQRVAEALEQPTRENPGEETASRDEVDNPARNKSDQA